MSHILKDLYRNLKMSSSYSGAQNLYREAKKINSDITLKDVKNYLKSEKSYTLHKGTKKRFSRRKIISPGPRIIASADLADMSKLAKYNNGSKFILVFIDSFSRFATAVPLKSKSAEDVLQAFKTILMHKNFKGISRLNTDEGKEFYNKKVQQFLKSENVTLYSVSSREIKAAIAERFIRTLKGRLFRYMTHHNTMKYMDALPDIIRNYNHTYHRTLKTTPHKVHHMNKRQVQHQFDMMYKNPNVAKKDLIPSLTVGDTVRIADENRNNLFRRGYTIQNTWEIFKIRKIDKSQNPVIYYLEDLNQEPIIGIFHREELIPTDLPETYEIEILKSKKVGNRRKYLVKWRGYPDQFNSWIDESDVKKV